MISPASSVVEINSSRVLRAIARDKSRRWVERDLAYQWTIVEGEGALETSAADRVTFRATAEPGLTRVRVAVTQGAVTCVADAQITITASLLPKVGGSDARYQGLPGYTYQRAAGELWRSRYDAERNLVVINSGHRDFVFASRQRMLKLRTLRPSLRVRAT